MMNDITDEMVERAAEQIYGGPHHRYKAEDGGDITEYTVAWGEVTEKLGADERDVYLRKARRILEAALAGRTVVDLPEPDDTMDGRAYWRSNDVNYEIATRVNYERQAVVDDGPRVMYADHAEAHALAVVAAARWSKRLRDEQLSSGVSGGDTQPQPDSDEVHQRGGAR